MVMFTYIINIKNTMKKILSLVLIFSLFFWIKVTDAINNSYSETLSWSEYEIFRNKEGIQKLISKINERLWELYSQSPKWILNIKTKIDKKLLTLNKDSSRYYILASISEYIYQLNNEKENTDQEIIITWTSSFTSYSSTKSFLESDVYNWLKIQRNTFYCNCDYDSEKNVNNQSCGFENNWKYDNRKDKVEWEHVVPAEAFWQSFIEWREWHGDCVDSKGESFKWRKCAEKVNELYKKMQADPINLVPSVGSINAQRSNYSFAIIEWEERQYWSCDFEIANRKAEPKEEVRWDIARIYKYMNAQYPNRGIIWNKNEKLFNAWDKEDPINNKECERINAIWNISNIWNECN